MSKLYLGTSGWNYKHWKEVFYPKGLPESKWLEHYVKYFDSVELNVTFYRLVQKETFRNWYKRTPKDFYFVAKGSRFITHIKRLHAVARPLNTFLRHVAPLKEKLIALLWQFAPSFKKDLARVEAFIKLLQRKTDVRQAFEFRHESWDDQEVYDLLKKYNVCLCTAHSKNRVYPKVETADFLYIRFHDASEQTSNFSERQLKEWSDYVKKFPQKDAMVFFNNDAETYAVQNTLRFRQLMDNPAK